MLKVHTVIGLMNLSMCCVVDAHAKQSPVLRSTINNAKLARCAQIYTRNWNAEARRWLYVSLYTGAARPSSSRRVKDIACDPRTSASHHAFISSMRVAVLQEVRFDAAAYARRDADGASVEPCASISLRG